MMVISSAVLAVAPKCPICFFAYFGIFGVATASASVYRVWLPPLTAIWLALTVGMLVFGRGGQRRYGPALLGVFAGLAVFAGKFVVNTISKGYGGGLSKPGTDEARSRKRLGKAPHVNWLESLIHEDSDADGGWKQR